MIDSTLSLYFHLPFCHHICSYCDLNAYAGLNHLMPRYVRALVKEIRDFRSLSDFGSLNIHTIYFGGGTPSTVPVESLKEIFSALRDSFSLTDDPEISFE
ncbi:MAG: coproporphyrinogen III oxidase family protein, partial [Chloroflexi bacterium]|nr:coproporphyrinogen III oxidase family protein [Chloroflexota bacterium]